MSPSEESATSTYRELAADRIVATLESLRQRIRERFPESGLGNVCEELLGIACESSARIERIRRPHWPVRVSVIVAIVGLLAIITTAALKIEVSPRIEGIAELLQGIEAAINEVVFLAVGIFFLMGIEARLRRRDALAAVHELRSIAHIIDMHQLTKDPEQFLSRGPATPSSPKRGMTRFQLSRYLDYCSELLSITSKIAALHVQHLNDGIVLEAVNDVEALCSGLSAKIWQKIMILDTVAPQES